MLTSLHERFLRRRLYGRIRGELLQHRHRELYDLRIGPGDIDAVARRGAYGANAPAGAGLRQAMAMRRGANG